MTPHVRIQHNAASMIALGGLLVVGHSCHAARLLRYEILVDQQSALTSIGTDNGRQNAAEIWSGLADVAWEAEEGFTLPTEEDDPQHLILTGDIQIQVTHAGKRVLTQSNVMELALTRDTGQTDRWRIPPAEVTRTGTAAGYSEAVQTRTAEVVFRQDLRWSLLVGALVLGLVALAIIVTVAIVLSSHRQQSTD